MVIEFESANAMNAAMARVSTSDRRFIMFSALFLLAVVYVVPATVLTYFRRTEIPPQPWSAAIRAGLSWPWIVYLILSGKA